MTISPGQNIAHRPINLKFMNYGFVLGRRFPHKLESVICADAFFFFFLSIFLECFLQQDTRFSFRQGRHPYVVVTA